MNPSSSRRSVSTRSKIGGIAVVVLVGLYSVLAPYANDRFDLNLPAIGADADGNVRVVDADQNDRPTETFARQTAEDKAKPTTKSLAAPDTSKRAPDINKRAPDTSQRATDASTKTRGPLADRMRPSSPSEKKSTTSAGQSQPDAADDGLYGILREVSRDRYVSPAGLVYTPGSAEGHRLEHLRRHTKDDPRRPGKHGVFDGDMEGALKTIDRAFQRAKKGQRTTKKQDRGRTIYTVDMGGRVGFIGGRDGNLKRKPMARRVRLVLEGDRVITAYPL